VNITKLSHLKKSIQLVSTVLVKLINMSPLDLKNVVCGGFLVVKISTFELGEQNANVNILMKNMLQLDHSDVKHAGIAKISFAISHVSLVIVDGKTMRCFTRPKTKEDLRKKPVGKDYYPLASTQDIQEMVFDPALANKPNPFMRPRPKDAPKLMAPKPKPALTQKPSGPSGGGFGGFGHEEETKADYGMGGLGSKPVSKYDPDQPVMVKGIAREGLGLGGSKSGSTLGTGSRIGTTGSRIGGTGTGMGTGLAKNSSVNKYGTGTGTGTSSIKGPVKSVPKKF